MALFAQKHFSSRNASLFNILINSAIYARASAAIIYRFIQNIYLPIIDIVLLFGGVYFIQDYWGKTYLMPTSYPWYYVVYVLPIYVIIWILSSFISGAYDRPFKVWNSIKGIGLGALVILVIYALLPEYLRFSRAIILFSTVWGMFSLGLLRGIFRLLKFQHFAADNTREKRIAIIGEIKETRRVAELMRNTPSPPGFISLVNTTKLNTYQEGVIGNLSQLEDLILIYGISELVFCSANLDASEIIRQMTLLNTAKVAYKIAPSESSAIIGSQSITQAGNLYMIDIDGILKPNNKRAKRLFDFFASLILLISSPFCIWLLKQKTSFLSNVFKVLFGFQTWVGYDMAVYNSIENLPSIKKGILFPKDAFPDKDISADISARLNLMYAQDYKLKNDLQILLKAWRELGRKD